MFKFLRTLGLTAAITAVLPAQAALTSITLNFDDLSLGALTAGAAGPYANGNGPSGSSIEFVGPHNSVLAGGTGHDNVLGNGCTASCNGTRFGFTVSTYFTGVLDFDLLINGSGSMFLTDVNNVQTEIVLSGVGGWQDVPDRNLGSTQYKSIMFQLAPRNGVIDNLSFSIEVPDTNNVPEPASAALLLLALAGAASATRRQRK